MKITRRLDANWDMTFGQGLANFCVNQEACAQNVRARLMVLLGEWYFDTSQGVFNPDMMQPPVSLPYLESRAKACILQTDDVQDLVSFSMEHDPETRKLTINASVQTIYGTVENIQVRLP